MTKTKKSSAKLFGKFSEMQEHNLALILGGVSSGECNTGDKTTSDTTTAKQESDVTTATTTNKDAWTTGRECTADCYSSGLSAYSSIAINSSSYAIY